MRHICVRVIVVIAVAGLLSSTAATARLAADQPESRAGGQGGPGDAQGPEPVAEYKGLTAGEWLAVWWQQVFATAVEGGSHPLINGGVFVENNGIVLMGGPVMPAGSPTATIRATIPTGTHLLVPIITVECSMAEAPPFHGENEAELRTCANGLLDAVSDLAVTIDGKPVNHPGAYRVESPLFRYGPLTADNVLGLPPGTQSDAVGAGYVLLLPPLDAGVHRIATRASVPAFGLATDTEVILTVRPTQ
jgi:hypothetical protein